MRLERERGSTGWGKMGMNCRYNFTFAVNGRPLGIPVCRRCSRCSRLNRSCRRRSNTSVAASFPWRVSRCILPLQNNTLQSHIGAVNVTSGKVCGDRHSRLGLNG